MNRAVRSIGLILVVGAASLTEAPRAEDYAACAKIENPLAYNACLARQGPPVHGTRAIAPPADADRPYAARTSTGAAHQRPGSMTQVSHGRHGRMVLEFSIGGGSDAAQKRKETR